VHICEFFVKEVMDTMQNEIKKGSLFKVLFST